VLKYFLSIFVLTYVITIINTCVKNKIVANYL